MRPHTLNRVMAAGHFRDDGVVIVAVEPSAIANLSAGLGIKPGMVENDLALLARLEFLRTLSGLDDGHDLAALGAGLAVAFEN